MQGTQVQILVRELLSFPYASGQWSLHAAITEPARWNQRVHMPQQKIPHDTAKTQHGQINQLIE